MTSDRIDQQDGKPRHSNAGWYAITAAILVAIALSNAFSERANYAGMGDVLPLREPLVWEFSSVFMIGVLLPALAWFYRRFPFHAKGWYWTAIIHALATLPFSVIHVAGMVALRKLVYALAGSSYHFGPVLPDWLYEYRKDFVTYWLIVLYLAAFGAWRYWRDAHIESRQAATPGQAPEPGVTVDRPDRLVVRKLNREFILDTADIARVESDGNYVTVHANGTTYQLRGSLSGLSRWLDDRRFVRIHRSQVVNIDHVREIQPWDHGDYRVL
ncbi:MAG: LytTR family DNA-binding domain-containing protein, partial [Rhodanobacteraceae bacterium]